jgi:hypothetical protein
MINELYSYRKNNVDLIKSLHCVQFDLYMNEKYKYKIKIFSNENSMWEYDKDNGFYGKHIPYAKHYSFKSGKKEFIGYEDKYNNCYQDYIGEILLCKGCLSSRHVVHEITHATLYYYNNFVDDGFKKLLNDINYEETFCYLLGDCVSLVYNVLYEYNLIE